MTDATRSHRPIDLPLRASAPVLSLLIAFPAMAVQDATEVPEGRDAVPEAETQWSEPIVVTATRHEQSIFDVPAFVDVVTNRRIAESLYRTLPEALRDVPGISVQKTAQGQGSPILRGFTGFRTLMLIDGIRLNNSVFREGPNQYWNTIDPYSIEQLEIVKGPSSVLYGSDAIGGTVNAITRGPGTGGSGEGFSYGGRAFLRLSSAERSHILRGELRGAWDETVGVYGGGSFKNFGDIEAGSGRKPTTGYDELDGDLKFEYLLDPDARLVVAHQSVDIDDAWRTHSTIFAEPFEESTIGSDLRRVLDQHRELTYLQFHAENRDSFIETARFSLSWHAQNEEEDRIRSDGRRDIQGFDVGTLGLTAQFETPSPVGRWTYGVEYYRDEVDSFRRTYNADGTLNAVRIQGPVADDASYTLADVYIQNDVPIGESLNLIVGGRYTSADAEADRVEDPQTGDEIALSDDHDALVASARLLYRIDEEDRWHLFGGASQGFRSPNLSDLTRLDFARSDEIETPSPGLDPEHFISYELGCKTRLDDFSAQVSFFHTDIDDMIVRQPTGALIGGLREVTKRNSGEGYVHGVELGASWRAHPQLTAFGTFAWMEGEIDAYPTSDPVLAREPLSRVMPTTLQLGLRWDVPTCSAWIEGVVTIADEADRLSSSDLADTQRIPPGGTPGYAVLSLRSGWKIQENLELTLAIDNVTDEDYRIHGSGVNEPGINLIFGLEYRF